MLDRRVQAIIKKVVEEGAGSSLFNHWILMQHLAQRARLVCAMRMEWMVEDGT